MEIAIALVVLILSIIAHEVAHGYAADALGDPTARLAGRLTMNPVPHIDPMGSILIPGLLMLTGSSIFFGWAKPVPYNPHNLRSSRWGEAFVAVAGSVTNLCLAILFGLLARFAPEIGLPLSAAYVATTIAFINLFLGLFNLIPFPPLDGFTALRSALPWRLSEGLRRFEDRIRSFGPAGLIAILLVFSFLLAGFFFRFVGWIFGFLIGIP